MKHVFLINSFTVKKRLEEIKGKIISYAKDHEIDYVIEVNSKTTTTEEILEKYKDGRNLVIVFGGDGIVNRTVNVLAGTDNKLMLIPYGTGNDFYKTVKKELKPGLNKIDVVRINDKYFVNTACFGIDADVANTKDRILTDLIPRQLKYYLALIYVFFIYKCRPLKIKVSNKEFENKYTTIAICNGSYYGGSFNIGPKSSILDNKLEIYLVNKLNRFSMMNLILKMKKGKHEKDSRVEKIIDNKLTITSPKPISANIDGEELISDKFDIEIISKGMNIYYDEEMLERLI